VEHQLQQVGKAALVRPLIFVRMFPHALFSHALGTFEISITLITGTGHVNRKENIVDKVMAEVELIERHIMMLRTVKENQPIGIIGLSEILGIPKHKVRYSLRLLEQDGLILPSTEGAMVTDGYDAFMAGMETSLDDLWKKIDRLRDIIPKT